MAATVAASEPRIEIVGERRRAYSAEFRSRLVAASLIPGARVQELARRHGICVSLIYRWRRATPSASVAATAISSARSVAASSLEFMPLGVFGRAEDEGPALITGSMPAAASQPASIRPASGRPAMDERPGVIEIDLADGTRLRVDAFVNERALRRVLASLKVMA